MEEKTVLSRYAVLKAEIKEREAEVEGLKETVMSILETKGADELQTEFGTFSRAVRRTYTYPAEITSLEVTLKERKKEAEATGTATHTEKPYILFKDTIK